MMTAERIVDIVHEELGRDDDLSEPNMGFQTAQILGDLLSILTRKTPWRVKYFVYEYRDEYGLTTGIHPMAAIENEDECIIFNTSRSKYFSRYIGPLHLAPFSLISEDCIETETLTDYSSYLT